MYIQIPLQAALERAFAKHLTLLGSGENASRSPRASESATIRADGSEGFNWRVRFKFFPHPSLTSASVAGQIAPVFILASLMFNFVMALSSVVS